MAQYEELLTRAACPMTRGFAVLGQLSRARLYAGQIAEAEAAMEEAQLLAGPAAATSPLAPWSTTPPRSW